MRADSEPPTPPVAFPVFLRLSGRRCLVVGGGRIGAEKAAALVAAGASVTMVATWFCAAAVGLPGVERHERPVQPSDLDGVWYAVAATGDAAVNVEIGRWADERRVWLNAVDDPASTRVLLGAVHRDGPLTVVVSTDGRSPSGAGWARDRIADSLGATAATIEAVARARALVQNSGRSTEGLPWRALLEELAAGSSEPGDAIARWLRTHLDD